MKEELITKSLEAFLTGAKVVGEEGRALISEVINYLLFSAVLDAVKTLVWALLGYAVFKIGKALVENSNVHENLEIKEIENGDSLWKSDKIKARLMNIKANNTVLYSITFVASLLWSLYSINTLRPIGKILTAPRLVLLQEGASILNSLKQTATK